MFVSFFCQFYFRCSIFTLVCSLPKKKTYATIKIVACVIACYLQNIILQKIKGKSIDFLFIFKVLVSCQMTGRTTMQATLIQLNEVLVSCQMTGRTTRK